MTTTQTALTSNDNALPVSQYDRFYGAKYRETEKLSRVEIAKLIRKDIAAAVKAGELAGVKTSVRCDCRSIDISIVAFDGVEREADEHQVAMNRQNMKRWPWLTDAARAVQEKLEQIHRAYNYDGSDLQSDYFDVRYYGSVSWRVRA